MEKGNKIRFVLWGFVFFIVLIASFVGIYSYLNGNGKYGKIREELKPIVTAFNNLENLNNYKKVDIDIKAELNKDTIDIKYTAQAIQNIYEFKYKKLDEETVLYTKYYSADSNTSQIIVRLLIDAISVVNNHNENDIFNKFSYGDFFETSIDQGVKLIDNKNEIEVYLNIYKTVLDTLTKEDIENRLIKETDLNDMNNTLEESKEFTLVKGNYTLYIKDDTSKYAIYIRNNKYNENMYKSIKAIINTLNIDKEIKDIFEINYPSITVSKEFPYYKVILDADASSINHFTEKDNVIRIEVTKEKEKTNLES